MSPSDTYAPGTPAYDLAALQHNSWLYTHEQDDIADALYEGGAFPELVEDYRSKINHRRAQWEMSR